MSISMEIGEGVQELIRTLSFDRDLMKRLADKVAESEGRFDLWVRTPDFGSVIRHRRASPSLWDKDGNKIAAAHISKDAPLPVKSGRFAGGWNWKIKGLNAAVKSRTKYAAHARKVGEQPGSGVIKVAEFLLTDWTKLAGEMADLIAESIGQDDLS